jgi:hypothetical protein
MAADRFGAVRVLVAGALLYALRKAGDSCGARIRVTGARTASRSTASGRATSRPS